MKTVSPEILAALERLKDTREFIADDLQYAYPGLHETHYTYLAEEGLRRATEGRIGGREWAMTACRLDWLDQQREKQPAREEEEELEGYFV